MYRSPAAAASAGVCRRLLCLPCATCNTGNCVDRLLVVVWQWFDASCRSRSTGGAVCGSPLPPPETRRRRRSRTRCECLVLACLPACLHACLCLLILMLCMFWMWRCGFDSGSSNQPQRTGAYCHSSVHCACAHLPAMSCAGHAGRSHGHPLLGWTACTSVWPENNYTDT